MQEIVVFLTKDYKRNATIWVSSDLDRTQIKEKLDNVFKKWYYYDIVKR